jgi:hypothetical protein
MATDPANAFDFIYGRWNVHNRKLRDNADPACDEWVEFGATSEAYAVLDDVGHIDRMLVPDPPDGGPFQAITLRLYNPADHTWRIWWSSTRVPGRLDPPMAGGFDGEHGIFWGDDDVNGRAVRIRFDWHAAGSAPTWEQRFSFDDGATWTLNWVMTFRRDSSEAAW